MIDKTISKNRISDYTCDDCSRNVRENEVVTVTRQEKVIQNGKVWDLESVDNIVKISCADCSKTEI